MMKLFYFLVSLPVVAFAALEPSLRGNNGSRQLMGGPPDIATIKVTSDNTCYESLLLNPLPFKGKFQQLDVTTSPPSTEYGPGDVGYVGGRWWVDANGNGEMDENDTYFACPLTTVTECPP